MDRPGSVDQLIPACETPTLLDILARMSRSAGGEATDGCTDRRESVEDRRGLMCRDQFVY